MTPPEVQITFENGFLEVNGHAIAAFFGRGIYDGMRIADNLRAALLGGAAANEAPPIPPITQGKEPDPPAEIMAVVAVVKECAQICDKLSRDLYALGNYRHQAKANGAELCAAAIGALAEKKAKLS